MERTVLEPGFVKDQSDQIKKTTNELKSSFVNAGAFESFKTVMARGLLNGYIPDKVTNTITQICSQLDKMTGSIDGYVEQMMSIDGQIQGIDTPDALKGGGGDTRGGGRYHGGKTPSSVTNPIGTDPYAGLIVGQLGNLIDFLKELAAVSGVSLEDLLTKSEYKTLLDEFIKKYQDIAVLIKALEGKDATEVQAWFRSIYNGEAIENIDLGLVDVLRNHINSIATKKGITPEELLINTQYAQEFKDSLAGYEKVSNFFTEISKAKNANNQQYLNDLYNGMKPEAYGFKKENIDSLKVAIDKIAKDNNIKVEDLLSKEENAALIKKNLATVDGTKALESIYGDASDKQAQKVVSNLYSGKVTSVEAAPVAK